MYFWKDERFKSNLISSHDLILLSQIKFILLISNVNSPSWFLYKKLGFVEDPIIKMENENYRPLAFYCNN